jgi:hypothetical protein
MLFALVTKTREVITTASDTIADSDYLNFECACEEKFTTTVGDEDAK